jgi:hypothetical protein
LKKMKTIKPMLLLFVSGLIVAGCMTKDPDEDSNLRQCSYNLWTLSEAVENTAICMRLGDGKTVPVDRSTGTNYPFAVVDLCPGSKLPRCPLGYDYAIPAVGNNAVCPYHGDVLAKYGYYHDGKWRRAEAVPERPPEN